MRALAEQGRGFPTRGGPGPDRARPPRSSTSSTSDGERPGPDEGAAALAAAAAAGAVRDRAGSAPGAARRRQVARRASTRCRAASDRASARDGDVVVGALAVVNAVGDVDRRRRHVLAGSTAPPTTCPGSRTRCRSRRASTPRCRRRHRRRAAPRSSATCSPRARTTAWPRAIHPSHTRYDGDLAFALATGAVDAHLDRLRVLAPR